MEDDKAIEFFKGEPIEYLAKDRYLSISLTLRSLNHMETQLGIHYGYEVEVQAEYDRGGHGSKAGWTNKEYTLYSNGSFEIIFEEMVDSANTLCHLLRSRVGRDKPHQSPLIKLMHQVEEEVKSDFLNSDDLTDLRKDLKEEYFT